MDAKVTARDVAKAAGVSVATVSYVINNGPRPVTDETRRKVQQVIQELGYRPNRLARGLTTGKTNAVGIVIPSIQDPFYPDLILGAENVAHDHGFSVFLCNSNKDPQREMFYIDLLADRQVDGLMIVGSRLDERELRMAARNHRAVIQTPYTISGAVSFEIDSLAGGRRIGEHLVSLGHRHIRFVEGMWSESAPLRSRGLREAMEAAGLPTEGVMAAAVAKPTVEAGREIALELFAREPEMTAVVCFNDVLAIGVLQACQEKGINVPGDLSVVGFDDIPEAQRTYPPLTTIRVDRCALGAQMMQTLLQLVDSETLEAKRTIFPVDLVVRASTGPPRQSRALDVPGPATLVEQDDDPSLSHLEGEI